MRPRRRLCHGPQHVRADPRRAGRRTGAAGGGSNRHTTHQCSCSPITPASRSRWRAGTTFHFVTDGFDAAYAQARETAGEDGVDIAGGAAVARSSPGSSRAHAGIAPVLLGSGERIFDGVESLGLEPIRCCIRRWRRTFALPGEQAGSMSARARPAVDRGSSSATGAIRSRPGTQPGRGGSGRGRGTGCSRDRPVAAGRSGWQPRSRRERRRGRTAARRGRRGSA